MRCVQIEATKHREGIVTHHGGILRSRMLMFIFNVMFDGLKPSVPFVITTTYNSLI
jgi:hypothetical protein